MSIEDIKTFMNTDTGALLGFISLVLWVLGLPALLWKRYKQAKKIFKDEKKRGILRDILIHMVFLLFGVIIPLLIIISTWSAPFGAVKIVLHILSWYAIMSYIGFIWILWKVLRILREEGL